MVWGSYYRRSSYRKKGYNRGKLGSRSYYARKNYSRRKPKMLKKSRYALDMATTYGTPFFKPGPRAWPQQMTATLPYCEEINLNAGTGTYSSVSYRANDLYDPYVAVGGHQPYGFDQYMNIYNFFAVEESEIKVFHSPTAVADNIPAYIAVIHSGSATAPTWANVEHFLEYCKDQKVPVHIFGSFNQGIHFNGRPLGACKATFKLSKTDGTNTADEGTWGTTSQSPANNLLEYYHVIAYSIGGNDPAAINMRLEISFKARFFNKIVLPRST